MGVLYLLLLVLLGLVILAFTVLLRVTFVLDTDREHMNLTLLWLYPLFKATVENSPGGLVLKVFLMKGKVYKRNLSKRAESGKSEGTSLEKLAEPENITIDTEYGFSDPFVTGVACGAINIAAASMGKISVRHTPDFSSDRDFVKVNAAWGINLGNTIVKIIKGKTKSK